MTNDEKLMQQALDALVHLWDGCPADESLISELNDRLAQPEPEPVAFVDKFGELLTPSQNNAWVRWKMKDKLPSDDAPMPLYPAPLQREFVELTDEEMSEAYNANYDIYGEHVNYADFVLIHRAIEAKLKEKNSG